MSDEQPITYAILIYDGVEPIDLGGTYGVLSMGRRVDPRIRMFLVAERPGLVRLANDLVVMADHGFDDCPPADALIVCGGPGWRREIGNPRMLDFLRAWTPSPVLASVCTGALILAAAGALAGLQATTRRNAVAGEDTAPLKRIATEFEDIQAVEALVVDNGPVVTGGGVSLAIDTTLHLIARLQGGEIADRIAEAIEYAVAWRANKQAFSALAR